jgi:hyperosmotically inducible protein
MRPARKRNSINVSRCMHGIAHGVLAAVLAVGTAGCWAAVVGAGAAAGAGGYAAAKSDKTAGEIVDDSILVTRVKTALLKSPLVRGLNINVDVDLGIVYLTGVATDQREIEEAIRLSRAVEGVRQVRSNLVLR